MDTKLLIFYDSEIVRSTNFVTIQKIVKKLKNIKFDHKRYFNMKIMFNGFDRQFKLPNLRYERETREALCFVKHLTIYIGKSYGASRSKERFALA
jgi:homoserine trans-succinylase